MRQLILVLSIFFVSYLHSAVMFDETVPPKLRAEISALIKENKITTSFFIEIHNSGHYFITSIDGYMKKLPVAKTTAEDIVNVIETMQEEIYIIKEKKQRLKQDWPVYEKEPVEEKRKKNVEFFSFAGPDSRFYTGLSISTEENWAAGFEFSAGYLFFRAGLGMKKGLNVDLGDGARIKWEAYGISVQMNFLRVWDLTFSFGQEVLLYNVNSRIYEKDFLYLGLDYKIKFFVPAIRFKFSPADVSLSTEGKHYKTDRINIMLMLNFAF